jgi:hypothetical protein
MCSDGVQTTPNQKGVFLEPDELDRRPKWRPRTLYKGLPTRIAMRVALGNLRWGRRPDRAYIARIFKMRAKRNARIACRHDMDTDNVPQLRRAIRCTPRFAPFRPKFKMCGDTRFCPFCFANLAVRSWYAFDAALFNQVRFAKQLRAEPLKHFSMIYQVLEGPWPSVYNSR